LFGLVLLYSISVAFSLLWIGSAAIYINDKIGWANILTLEPNVITALISSSFIPVAVLWLVISFIQQSFAVKRQNRFTQLMLQQVKTSSGHNEAIVRTMIELYEHNRSARLLDRIDFNIQDINELLCEIAQRLNLISLDAIEALWRRASQGNKWVFCKVIIESDARHKNLSTKIIEQAKHDAILAGSLLEFGFRFEKLIEILHKYDRERFMKDLVENGVMGRVYAILAPALEALDRSDIKDREIAWGNVETAWKEYSFYDRQYSNDHPRDLFAEEREENEEPTNHKVEKDNHAPQEPKIEAKKTSEVRVEAKLEPVIEENLVEESIIEPEDSFSADEKFSEPTDEEIVKTVQKREAEPLPAKPIFDLSEDTKYAQQMHSKPNLSSLEENLEWMREEPKEKTGARKLFDFDTMPSGERSFDNKEEPSIEMTEEKEEEKIEKAYSGIFAIPSFNFSKHYQIKDEEERKEPSLTKKATSDKSNQDDDSGLPFSSWRDDNYSSKRFPKDGI